MSGHRPTSSPHSPSARRGFTLVEMLIVIVIIALLVALLLPAIGAVRNRVRVAQVRNEITGFESGITQFVGEFGTEPPSKITLYEAGAQWALDMQSKNQIRELWPQFRFEMDRDLNANDVLGETDPDGDGNPGITLSGDECLVFFLGGPDTIDGDGNPETKPHGNGFSKNPQDPFAAGGARTGPFFEFDPDRLVDHESVVGAKGDGAHSYAHIYPGTQTPYLYLSSYGGRGYRTLDADMNQNGTIDSPNPPTESDELDGAYLQSQSVYWKDNSYQIISAGADGILGRGGGWSQEDGVDTDTSSAEDRDNITSFSSGTLN